MSEGQAVQAAARRLIDAFDGEAAFLARHLGTGRELGHRADAVMPTASTIKVLVLAELFRQVEAGTVALDDRVAVTPDDRRGGSGVLKDLAGDLALAVRDHATLMIALSDNVATAVLVRLLTLGRILASARDWGLGATTATFRQGGPIRDYASSTPRDIVRLLALIADDALVSPAACAGIRDLLLTQQDHDQLARYLPFNPYRRDRYHHPGPVVVRSKSGFSAGVRVDAGIVELPGRVRYVLCLMTAGSSDRSFRPEQAGAVLNGRLSRLVFDAWWPVGTAKPQDD